MLATFLLTCSLIGAHAQSLSFELFTNNPLPSTDLMAAVGDSSVWVYAGSGDQDMFRVVIPSGDIQVQIPTKSSTKFLSMTGGYDGLLIMYQDSFRDGRLVDLKDDTNKFVPVRWPAPLQSVAYGYLQGQALMFLAQDENYGVWLSRCHLSYQQADGETGCSKVYPLEEPFPGGKPMLVEIGEKRVFVVTGAGILYIYSYPTNKWTQTEHDGVVALANLDGRVNLVYALKGQNEIVMFQEIEDEELSTKTFTANVPLQDIDVNQEYMVGLGVDNQVYYAPISALYADDAKVNEQDLALNMFAMDKLGNEQNIYRGVIIVGVLIGVLVWFVWNKWAVQHKEYAAIGTEDEYTLLM